MMQRIYVLAEGVVDVTFLATLLKSHFRMTKIQYADELGAWENFQRRTFAYPRTEGDRINIGDFSIRTPEYFRNASGNQILALRVGNGDQIWSDLDQDLKLLERDAEPHAVAIIGDADDQEPAERFREWTMKLRDLGLPVPAELGAISIEGNPKIGTFLFPGGGKKGTVEDVLLALGSRSYPVLRDKAGVFVASISDSDVSKPADLKEFRKFAGRNKAELGAMTAILKPGFATPRTITNDRWLDPESVNNTPEIGACIEFLSTLLSAVSAPL